MMVFNVDFHACCLLKMLVSPIKLPPPPRCQRSAASRCLKARTLWFVCLFGGEKFSHKVAILQPTNQPTNTTNLSNQHNQPTQHNTTNQPTSSAGLVGPKIFDLLKPECFLGAIFLVHINFPDTISHSILR